MTRRRTAGMLRLMRASGTWFGLGIALLSVLPGCAGGTETGNPSFSGSLSYTGYSSAPEAYGVGKGGSVATIKRAWLDLAAVQVSSSGNCGLSSADAFTVPALGVGDHAAGKHNATAFEARAGSFCSVRLPFERVDSSVPGAPAELMGHAILIEGSLADGTPFSLISDAVPQIQLQSNAAGFALSGAVPNALIAFDFAGWLRDVDFGSATRDQGRLTIVKGTNDAQLKSFESNLAAGVALYRDRDGDGVLDTSPELLAR